MIVLIFSFHGILNLSPQTSRNRWAEQQEAISAREDAKDNISPSFSSYSCVNDNSILLSQVTTTSSAYTSSSSSSSFSLGVSNTTSEKVYPCPQCTAVFKHHNSLLQHIKGAHRKPHGVPRSVKPKNAQDKKWMQGYNAFWDALDQLNASDPPSSSLSASLLSSSNPTSIGAGASASSSSSFPSLASPPVMNRKQRQKQKTYVNVPDMRCTLCGYESRVWNFGQDRPQQKKCEAMYNHIYHAHLVHPLSSSQSSSSSSPDIMKWVELLEPSASATTSESDLFYLRRLNNRGKKKSKREKLRSAVRQDAWQALVNSVEAQNPPLTSFEFHHHSTDSKEWLENEAKGLPQPFFDGCTQQLSECAWTPNLSQLRMVGHPTNWTHGDTSWINVRCWHEQSFHSSSAQRQDQWQKKHESIIQDVLKIHNAEVKEAAEKQEAKNAKWRAKASTAGRAKNKGRKFKSVSYTLRTTEKHIYQFFERLFGAKRAVYNARVDMHINGVNDARQHFTGRKDLDAIDMVALEAKLKKDKEERKKVKEQKNKSSSLSKKEAEEDPEEEEKEEQKEEEGKDDVDVMDVEDDGNKQDEGKEDELEEDEKSDAKSDPTRKTTAERKVTREAARRRKRQARKTRERSSVANNDDGGGDAADGRDQADMDQEMCVTREPEEGKKAQVRNPASLRSAVLNGSTTKPLTSKQKQSKQRSKRKKQAKKKAKARAKQKKAGSRDCSMVLVVS